MFAQPCSISPMARLLTSNHVLKRRGMVPLLVHLFKLTKWPVLAVQLLVELLDEIGQHEVRRATERDYEEESVIDA